VLYKAGSEDRKRDGQRTTV